MSKKNFLEQLNEDRAFLRFVHLVEKIVAKVLSLALIFIVLVSLSDLVIYLFKDTFNGKTDKTLIEIFGLFLNILIALELLENITAYLRKHVVQVELVLVTSLIAVARKIIIFDSVKKDSQDLMALGFAILCLSIGYLLVRLTRPKK